MKPEKIILVNMPFGPLNMPSLGLSLLKGELSQQGYQAKICYFNVVFADLIGEEIYHLLSRGFPRNIDQVGEWIFSNNLFPDKEEDSTTFINEIILGNNEYHSKEFYLKSSDLEQFVKAVMLVREKVEGFIETCVEAILKEHPKIVGFTSVFQQHIASLALAKKLKEKRKDLLIVFGGANCEGPMGEEIVEQFDFVDVVISGEGDEIFPKLVDTYYRTGAMIEAQGVYSKRYIYQKVNTPAIHEMDDIAIPDFFDFFKTYKSYAFKRKPKLLLETSRGCWWGEKKHCTFCGLNGGNMAFRSKSENRVISEFLLMKELFPAASIAIVDNILDMNYFKNLLPSLVEEKLDLDLFFEVKANLKKPQVKLLKEAGINTIQPGIESFSDNVLTIMDKGVRAIQNIQLLKWCKEYEVDAQWNLIWGFHGETKEDYDLMIDLIPFIIHLKPPAGGSTLRLDRFSPNYDKSEHYGFEAVKPYPSYKYLYPFTEKSLGKLAYFFSFQMDKNFDQKKLIEEILDLVATWRKDYKLSDLFFVDKEKGLLIWDFRPMAKQTFYLFEKEYKSIYLFCDVIKTEKQLLKMLVETHDLELSKDQLLGMLTIFLDAGLMIKSNNYYLSLAIPTYTYVPSNKVLEQLDAWI